MAIDLELSRAATAQRYLNNGVLLANMFRTDLGDDDVDIVIRQNGTIAVGYGDTDYDEVIINVVDTTPPEVTCAPVPIEVEEGEELFEVQFQSNQTILST